MPGRYHAQFLTRNQVDALEHVAAGWRCSAIGAASGRDASTIEGALAIARRRLGAQTNAEAVAIALDRNLLDRPAIALLRLQRRVAGTTLEVAA